MNQRPSAELRIHTGVHAGAREVLADGRHVLGADSGCDLVISDDGVGSRHAELCIEGATWVLLPLQPMDGVSSDGLLLAPGQAIGLGSVVITVDAANAPWPAVVPRLLVASPAANDSRVSPVLAEGREAGQAPALARREPVVAATAPRSGVIFAWLALTVAVVLLAWGLTAMLRPEEMPPEPPPAATGAADRAEQERRVTAVLDALGLTGRADVTRRPDGGLVVNAMLVTDVEYEVIAAALAQLNPRPGLRVSSEKELVQSVRDAVAARGEHFSADYLGAGRFRIHGNVANEDEHKSLLRALAGEFPAARGFESALLLPAGMADAMLAMLRENGFSRLHGAWRDNLFVVDAKVADADLPGLKQLLSRIDARYGQWLKFSMRIETPPALERVEVTLPFRLRGVVGGETPYVVLADGNKVLPGGQVGVWRLAEITTDQVVFDGPQRITVRR